MKVYRPYETLTKEYVEDSGNDADYFKQILHPHIEEWKVIGASCGKNAYGMKELSVRMENPDNLVEFSDCDIIGKERCRQFLTDIGVKLKGFKAEDLMGRLIKVAVDTEKDVMGFRNVEGLVVE